MINVAWRPFPGTSQERFLACPFRNILFSGTRGPGKTESTLIKFHKNTGKEWGADWRGIIFAQRYKNLDDVVAKGKKLFKTLGVGIEFKESKDTYKFVWPCGAELLLRVAKDVDAYWDYHGHGYPFVAFEELTKWPDSSVYDVMKSINRSPVPGIPKHYIGTTNPFGAGHGWVKALWIDPKPKLSTKGTAIYVDGLDEPMIRFDGNIYENTYLVENDPEYIQQLETIENEALREAWLFGNWDINAGSYFHGYLTKERNMVKPFMPPLSWPRFKAFDWGSARPYSIGYYAVDPDGVIYRYREIYGWSGKPNIGTGETWEQISERMTKAEEIEVKAGVKFFNNPADHNLWTNQGFEKDLAELFLTKGHSWQKANKGPGSIINGLSVMKEMFAAGTIKVTSDCEHWWRTVPNLMPDENNWEVIDTDGEDHACDETRYAVMSRHMKAKKDKKKVKKITSSLTAGDPRFAHLLQ